MAHTQTRTGKRSSHSALHYYVWLQIVFCFNPPASRYHALPCAFSPRFYVTCDGNFWRKYVLTEYSGIGWNSTTMKCIENVFLVYSSIFGKLRWSTKLLQSNAFRTHAYGPCTFYINPRIGAFITCRSIYECIYEAFRKQLCIPASRNTWSHAPVYKLCSIFHICSNFTFRLFSRSKMLHIVCIHAHHNVSNF